MFQQAILKTEDKILIRPQQYNWMRIQIRICNPALYISAYYSTRLSIFETLSCCHIVDLLPTFPI
jgi:hypothetical protein